MTIIKLTILLLLICITSYSQFNIKIDNIFIAPLSQTNSFVEDETWVGPYIFIDLEIKNSTDTLIKIDVFNSHFYLVYQKDDIYYQKSMKIVDERDFLIVKKNETLKLTIWGYMLYGTNLYNPKIVDYNSLYEQIWETIQVQYIDKQNNLFFNSSILGDRKDDIITIRTYD